MNPTKTDELLDQVVKLGRFKSREVAEEAALRAYLEHVHELRRARGGVFLILEWNASLIQRAKHEGEHASKTDALQAALEHFLRVNAAR